MRRAIFTTLLVIPFVFFSLKTTPWHKTEAIVWVVQGVIYPFEYAYKRISSGTSSLIHNYLFLRSQVLENDHLKKELQAAQRQILDYEHKNSEVNRLRELLDFRKRIQSETIAAEVMNVSKKGTFQSLRISRGYRDHVEIGMPILGTKGVIGKIIRRGYNFADVQILTDGNFFLDVMIERTRDRGVLRGMFHDRCMLTLSKRADIKINDRVVTSGLMGTFPKGILVGEITKIEFASNRVAQRIIIAPTENTQSIEEVLIVKAFDSQIEAIREIAGDPWLTKATGN